MQHSLSLYFFRIKRDRKRERAKKRKKNERADRKKTFNYGYLSNKGCQWKQKPEIFTFFLCEHRILEYRRAKKNGPKIKLKKKSFRVVVVKIKKNLTTKCIVVNKMMMANNTIETTIQEREREKTFSCQKKKKEENHKNIEFVK